MRLTPAIEYRLPTALAPVERWLRNLGDRIRDLAGAPIIRGKLLTGVQLNTAGVAVYHGLDRVPSGASIVLCDDSSVRSYSAYDANKKTITVKTTSGTPTVSLWVF